MHKKSLVKDHAVHQAERNAGARERILNVAYQLFSEYGIVAVGIDTIIAKSDVAKTTFYRHFTSKEELVLAFFQRRELLWTRQWLEAGIMEKKTSPTQRLLAIFDLFDQWFQRKDFEGCSFINGLIESVPKAAVHQAATSHLAEIRKIVLKQAKESRLSEPEKFSQVWHFLMKGCIISAQEGNKNAAKQAKEAGGIILENWLRT